MMNRTFLEPAKSHIDSYVVTDIDTKDQSRSLKIADCNSTITLDFSSGQYDTRTASEALAKLDKLQRAINRIGRSIEQAGA